MNDDNMNYIAEICENTWQQMPILIRFLKLKSRPMIWIYIPIQGITVILRIKYDLQKRCKITGSPVFI